MGRDERRSESKGDFALTLNMLIEAGPKTGYVAPVKRAIDGLERYSGTFWVWNSPTVYFRTPDLDRLLWCMRSPDVDLRGVHP